MKSNPNEPESAPRRPDRNRVIIAWALGGFLLAQLVMLPPKTEPAATPTPARSDAGSAAPAASETSAFERPGRERPTSRERLYREIPVSAPVAQTVSAPGSAGALNPPQSPPEAVGPADGASSAAASKAGSPEPAVALEAGGYPIPGAFIDRPGRPETRPESRDFDIRGSDPRHTLASD